MNCKIIAFAVSVKTGLNEGGIWSRVSNAYSTEKLCTLLVFNLQTLIL